MKIQDIEVGKRYRHLHQDGDVFLGVGRRKLFTDDEFVEKHLVLIEAKDNMGIGLIAQEGKDARPNYWDFFVKSE